MKSAGDRTDADHGVSMRSLLESIAFTHRLLSQRVAGAGKVKATVSRAKIEEINDIFVRMHKGQIEGRIVLDMAA